MHSLEAVRFMCDTDVLLGGLGLFGGRGEYFGKIKVSAIAFTVDRNMFLLLCNLITYL